MRVEWSCLIHETSLCRGHHYKSARRGGGVGDRSLHAQEPSQHPCLELHAKIHLMRRVPLRAHPASCTYGQVSEVHGCARAADMCLDSNAMPIHDSSSSVERAHVYSRTSIRIKQVSSFSPCGRLSHGTA